MLKSYSPTQRNVFPGLRCSPSRFTPRSRSNEIALSGKSSPTTPTNWTRVYRPAAMEKKTAVPPRASSARPNGVSTVSSATDPTTRVLTATPLSPFFAGPIPDCGTVSQRPRSLVHTTKTRSVEFSPATVYYNFQHSAKPAYASTSRQRVSSPRTLATRARVEHDESDERGTTW